VKPELVLVVAVVLAIVIRIMWRELLGVIVICCLAIVFIGILYLFAVTSPDSLSGT
jgi:hypothetical protein